MTLNTVVRHLKKGVVILMMMKDIYIPANVVEGDANILEAEIIEGDHTNKYNRKGQNLNIVIGGLTLQKYEDTRSLLS